MKKNTKKEIACQEFFDKLAALLHESYEVIDSCNADSSRYLIPNGKANLITYTSKPAASFRVSDHWNWYSNVKKCPNENYIQCFSLDAPWPKKRSAKGKSSTPIFCSQVSFVGGDGKYHVVYGEKYDHRTRTWSWIETSPEEVIWEVL